VHSQREANAPDAGSMNMRDLERQAIERSLAANGGNVSATARQLGISRNTIYRRRNGLD
jgi:transcriptional regulator of acetoin/glycerol metabolism